MACVFSKYGNMFGDFFLFGCSCSLSSKEEGTKRVPCAFFSRDELYVDIANLSKSK